VRRLATAGERGAKGVGVIVAGSRDGIARRSIKERQGGKGYCVNL
jgi:hypothetical protein